MKPREEQPLLSATKAITAANNVHFAANVIGLIKAMPDDDRQATSQPSHIGSR